MTNSPSKTNKMTFSKGPSRTPPKHPLDPLNSPQDPPHPARRPCAATGAILGDMVLKHIGDSWLADGKAFAIWLTQVVHPKMLTVPDAFSMPGPAGPPPARRR